MSYKNKLGYQLIELLIAMAIIVSLLACTLPYISFHSAQAEKRAAEELVSFLQGARLLALESGETLDLIQPTASQLLLRKRSSKETVQVYECPHCTLIFNTALPSFKPEATLPVNGHFEIKSLYAKNTSCVTLNRVGRARVGCPGAK